MKRKVKNILSIIIYLCINSNVFATNYVPENEQDYDLVEIIYSDNFTPTYYYNGKKVSTLAEEDYISPDEMPQFRGGEKALVKFLNSSIKYPVEAQEKNIQRRVICKFTIDQNGKPTNIQIVKSVAPSLDNEAIRLIKSMPKWIPAPPREKPLEIEFTLPLSFKLNYNLQLDPIERERILKTINSKKLNGNKMLSPTIDPKKL